MILPQTDFANTYILQVYASIKDTRIGARKLANFVKVSVTFYKGLVLFYILICFSVKCLTALVKVFKWFM